MITLALNTADWDLTLDASGNIATADVPYALAQDVASAVRTFLGEVFYNTKLGIPYFEDVLGYLPPTSLLTQLIVDQALTVPGVVSATCTIESFNANRVSGTIEITDSSNNTTAIEFTN